MLSLISVVQAGGDMGVMSDIFCTGWGRHGC